jgi:hypothetical protein
MTTLNGIRVMAVAFSASVMPLIAIQLSAGMSTP